MDRHLVISSDCHAGLPLERYRDYLDPKYREAFDRALPIQLEQTRLGGNAVRCYGFDADKLAPTVARIGPEKRVFAS